MALPIYSTTANRLSAEYGGEYPAAGKDQPLGRASGDRATRVYLRVIPASELRTRLPDISAYPRDQSTEETTDKLLEWAKLQHASGTLLCSVCGGAFILARLGLLNGRSATTHWSYADLLATSFPEIYVNTDELIIDLGDVVTAGGVMAWLDLGLKLVDQLSWASRHDENSPIFPRRSSRAPAAFLRQLLTTAASRRRSDFKGSTMAPDDAFRIDQYRHDGGQGKTRTENLFTPISKRRPALHQRNTCNT